MEDFVQKGDWLKKQEGPAKPGDLASIRLGVIFCVIRCDLLGVKSCWKLLFQQPNVPFLFSIITLVVGCMTVEFLVL